MAYQQILPADTKLSGEFQILAHLGSGGFANTYRALELSLGREVAIKEYFPSDLAVRADDLRVEAKTRSEEKHFRWGLRRFIREAQTVAKFRHPSVVRVHRVFEENQTAYIVMEFVSGSNMEAWLQALGRPPTQTDCDRFIPPLLDALEVIHSAGILHRDIKPANIYIRAEDRSPVLLDFGSARHAVADQAGTTAAIVSKGYSPHEAYTTDTKKQGPWSDIYGLAATVYRSLSGQAPPESTQRMLEDTYTPPKSLPATQTGYRDEFLDAIDAALKVMPKDRPQSISDWRKQLFPTLAPTTIDETHAQPSETTKIWKPISDDFSASPSSTTETTVDPQRSGLFGSKALAFRVGLTLSLIGSVALFATLNPASIRYVQDLLQNGSAKLSSQSKNMSAPQSLPTTPRETKPTTDQTPANKQENQRVKTAEVLFWESIDRDNPKELRAYLDAYPLGKFVTLARIRLNKIEQVAAEAREQEQKRKAEDEALAKREEAAKQRQRAKEAERQRVLQEQRDRKRKQELENKRRLYQARLLNERGLKLEKGGDRKGALRFYRQAAEMGSHWGMHNVGICYYNGWGVKRNYTEAVRWLRRAVKKGNSNALFMLAVSYDGGKGVQKNHRQAARFIFELLKIKNATALEEMTKNSKAWSREFRLELQRLMKDAGVYNGAIDGSFGENTRLAIKALTGQ